MVAITKVLFFALGAAAAIVQRDDIKIKADIDVCTQNANDIAAQAAIFVKAEGKKGGDIILSDFKALINSANEVSRDAKIAGQIAALEVAVIVTALEGLLLAIGQALNLLQIGVEYWANDARIKVLAVLKDTSTSLLGCIDLLKACVPKDSAGLIGGIEGKISVVLSVTIKAYGG